MSVAKAPGQMTPAIDSRGVNGGRFDGPQDSWTGMKHKSRGIAKGSLAWNECKIDYHGGENVPAFDSR
jgi:hypothetical protein